MTFQYVDSVLGTPEVSGVRIGHRDMGEDYIIDFRYSNYVYDEYGN